MDSQKLEKLDSRFDSACDAAAKAGQYLIELAKQHGLDVNDSIFYEQPSDSPGSYQDVSVSREEAEAFEKMSDAEKTAWYEKRVAANEAERQTKQASLPADVRAALVRFNELRAAEHQAAKALAEAMYKRGIIGVIADRLGLQEDSEIELYLDIPESE
jgi:hypothetical protein